MSIKHAAIVLEWDKEFSYGVMPLVAVSEQTGKDGNKVPIAHANRMTTTAEKKYGAMELEVATLIYALEHFEVYLLGNQTIVYTDHKVLVQLYLPYLKDQQKGMLARFYFIFCRCFRLEHKTGSAASELH